MTTNGRNSHYCPKCGQSWAVHNDDGSCVDDVAYDHEDYGGDETKCWRCQQKAVLNGICGACGEEQE
jgi:hypothetical protein